MWLYRAIKTSRTDLTQNQGFDDGGANISGPLFPGQAQLFNIEEEDKKNVHKKKRNKKYNCRGE